MYERAKHFVMYAVVVVLAILLMLWLAIALWAASNGTFVS